MAAWVQRKWLGSSYRLIIDLELPPDGCFFPFAPGYLRRIAPPAVFHLNSPYARPLIRLRAANWNLLNEHLYEVFTLSFLTADISSSRNILAQSLHTNLREMFKA